MTTKKEFLDKLRKELSELPTDEVNDIIRDQEEYIHEAVSSGRTEADVVAKMGDPEKFAAGIKSEINFDKIENKLNVADDDLNFTIRLRSVLAAAAALLVLAPFNLIFVLGPFLGILGVLFGGWVSSLTIGLVGLGLVLVVAVTAVFSGINFWAPLTLLAGALAMVFFGMVALSLMFFVTSFVVKLMSRYLRWNLNFVRRQI